MTSLSEERLQSLVNTSFELIALTCLLISTKIHETDLTCLRIFELEKEFRYKYTFKNFTTCEQRILEEMNWCTYVQTPLDYTNLFMSAGILFTDDTYEINGKVYKISHHMVVEKEEAIRVSKIYDSLKKLIVTDYYNHGYEMLQFDDRLVALTRI